MCARLTRLLKKRTAGTPWLKASPKPSLPPPLPQDRNRELHHSHRWFQMKPIHKNQAQTRNSMNCYRLIRTAGSCHQPQPCPGRKVSDSRGAEREAGEGDMLTASSAPEASCWDLQTLPALHTKEQLDPFAIKQHALVSLITPIDCLEGNTSWPGVRPSSPLHQHCLANPWWMARLPCCVLLTCPARGCCVCRIPKGLLQSPAQLPRVPCQKNSSGWRAGENKDSALQGARLIQILGMCWAQLRPTPDTSPHPALLTHWKRESALYPAFNFLRNWSFTKPSMNKTCLWGILKAELRRPNIFVGVATAALNITTLEHPSVLRCNQGLQLETALRLYLPPFATREKRKTNYKQGVKRWHLSNVL